MPALGGEVTEGKGLSIGYFAQQEMDVVHADDTPLQHMVRLARTVGPEGREQELRDFLGQFRFVGDMVHQTIGTLSGGEKARLVLASLVWQRPNLLLMDEPTNHLDLTTREALSMALNEFEGTVMLVSHDRALLREVCDEFWLVSHGAVLPFDGDLDDYQKWLLETSRAISRGQPAPPLPGNLNDLLPPAAAPAPAAPKAGKARQEGGVHRSECGRGARRAAAPAPRQHQARRRPQRRPQAVGAAALAGGRADAPAARRGAADRRAHGEARPPRRPSWRPRWPPASWTAPGIADAGRRLAHVGAEVAKLEERWLELNEQIEALQSGA